MFSRKLVAVLAASAAAALVTASIPPPSTPLREKALYASANAAFPHVVSNYLQKYASKKRKVEERVAQILANLTNDQKAAQCDQW